MIAYADEAAHRPSRTYVFAAALVPPGDADVLRDDLVKVLRPGQRRFQWHTDSREVRLAMLAVIGQLDLTHWVYVSRSVRARDEYPFSRPWVYRGGNGRWDLARGAALQRFASRPALTVTADELVIVSRGDANDVKDKRNLTDPRPPMLGPRRAARPAYRFALPVDEPLLWVPDAVAGAVLALYSRGDSSYVDHVSAWRRRGLRRRRTGPLKITVSRW